MKLSALLRYKPTRLHLEIGAVLVALGTIGAMVWQMIDWHRQHLDFASPIFGDFMSFWTAGRLVLEGKVALVHDVHALMETHREAIPGFTKYFPWHSPPVFLLFVTPLALMPYVPAALVFLAISLAIYLIGMRGVLPDRRALLFTLTTPTALFQFGSIQVAFAVTGFVAFAARWLEKRPIAAGAAIAMLAIKPHLAVLWPLMLAVRGRWRTFFAAGFFTAALLVIAGLAFGFDSYVRFVENLSAAQRLVTNRGLPPNTLTSLYANLISLRVPAMWAMAAHYLSTALALILCVLIWRRSDQDTATATAISGALLMSPYLFFYDSLSVGVAIALLARKSTTRLEMIAFAFIFSLGAICLYGARKYAIPFGPMAAWGMMLVCGTRAGVLAWPRLFTRKESAAASLA